MIASSTANRSYWALKAPDREPAEPAAGPLSADVAIVGAGLTGLSTAWHLKQLRPDADVVLLEAETVGNGASGRNSGWVMPHLGLDPAALKLVYGAERTRAALEFAYAACDYVEELVGELALDCDYRRHGYTLVAVDEAGREELDATLKLYRDLGLGDKLEPLPAEEVGAHYGSPLLVAGVREPAGALLDPMRLVQGWERRVSDAGVRLHERSPVLRIEQAAGCRTLTTPTATVDAKQVVLATNAYTQTIAGLDRGLRLGQAPLYVYGAMTEPLSDELWAELGWERRDAIKTVLSMPHIFHPMPDGRIHLAYEVHVDWPARAASDFRVEFAREAERQLHALFPPLRDVRIEYHWGGPVSLTLDLVPHIGITPDRSLAYAFGWWGHGVSVTQLTGKLLAEMVTGAGDEVERPWFARRRSLPWPTAGSARRIVGPLIGGQRLMHRRRLRGSPLA